MYSKFQLGSKYLRYWLTAQNGKGHGIHAPFVFELVTQVFNDTRNFYAYSAIEQQRQQLLTNHQQIQIEDFGAGSRILANNKRKIADIARSSLKPSKYGQLFFRIIQHYGYSKVLELGTSLGITTSYLAAANTNGTVISFEGAKAIAATAKNNFNQLGYQNIQVIEGNFDITLPQYLSSCTQSFDFIFMDGNHRYLPTIQYFEQLLPFTHEYSIVVVDDIHWSKEMEQAWHEICAHPQVNLSIDLFFIGLIFFRKENKEKQHFTIRF